MRKPSPNQKNRKSSPTEIAVMDSPSVLAGVESTIQSPSITQLRLAHVQELQAQVLKGKRDESLLKKERAQIRSLLLRGVTVEEGYITAVLVGPKKRLVVS